MNKINKCDSCNNIYSHRQSLWRHKQNCNNDSTTTKDQADSTTSKNRDYSNDDNDSGIEPMEITAKDDKDEDDDDNDLLLTKKILMIIVNKYRQLLYETKGENTEILIILHGIIKDCKVIIDNIV